MTHDVVKISSSSLYELFSHKFLWCKKPILVKKNSFWKVAFNKNTKTDAPSSLTISVTSALHNLQQNTTLCLRWGKTGPFSHKNLPSSLEKLPSSQPRKLIIVWDGQTPGIFRIGGTCGAQPLLTEISPLPQGPNEIPPGLNIPLYWYAKTLSVSQIFLYWTNAIGNSLG